MPPALQHPVMQWFLATAVLAALSYTLVRRELRLRATVYASFLVACILAFWPPYERIGADGKTIPGKIRLGLDLSGGVHLVLQVVTDDALNATVDDAVQVMRERLTQKGIAFASAQRQDSASFVIEGVEAARVKDARDLLREALPRGWEQDEGTAGRFTVKLTDSEVRAIRERTVDEAIKTMERRVNVLGVAEPLIAKHGDKGDQILVQLPGVRDIATAKRTIQKTAQLQLKLVVDSNSSREALLATHAGKEPVGMEVVQGAGDTAGVPVFYLVQREAIITGRDMKNARVGVDQNNQPDVEFTLSPTGSEKFGRATGGNIGKKLAIILDGMVESAPVINAKITTSGEITGRYSRQEAEELARVLRAGALPASLKPLQELSVGASLGKDSVRSGVLSAIAGMSFLALFMVVYYRLSGVNAIVALAANLVILLGAMAYFEATLTLPGIAGVILTVGVGVDTNVLVFERIREEIRNGKPVRNAISNGFDRVWITILDTHATALIAAAFLFQFGTGPIKGFAVTLVWGLVANVFASYFVSKFLFEWILGKRQVSSLSI
jgi:preprotein translocase subunit SecD